MTTLPKRAFRRFHRTHHVAATRETLLTNQEMTRQLHGSKRIADSEKQALLHALHSEQTRTRDLSETIERGNRGILSRVIRFVTRRRS